MMRYRWIEKIHCVFFVIVLAVSSSSRAFPLRSIESQKGPLIANIAWRVCQAGRSTMEGTPNVRARGWLERERPPPKQHTQPTGR